MGCPGGCVNGGGQPQQPASVRNTVDIRALRAKYYTTKTQANTIRKSHENPAIKELYETYLENQAAKKRTTCFTKLILTFKKPFFSNHQISVHLPIFSTRKEQGGRGGEVPRRATGFWGRRERRGGGGRGGLVSSALMEEKSSRISSLICTIRLFSRLPL